MKILVVCQYYYPEPFLIHEISEELVNRGHEVTVVTGLPNYSNGIVPDEYKHRRKRHEIINGVEVIRCYEGDRKKSAIGLLGSYVTFAVSSSLKILFMKKKYDVVFSYQLSPITQVLPAILYKKLTKKKLLVYVLDIFPESIKSHISSEDNFFYKAISNLSNWIYSKADHISVTSSPFLEYLKNTNKIDESKMSYIPQHANGQYLNEELDAGENGISDFMFAGNLGHGQTLEVIVKAAGVLKERTDFCVHIVGDGACLEDLKQLAVEEGVSDKIIFHGRHPSSEMREMYKKADALLLTLRGNNFVGNTMPGKLQTYMTTGKPIFGAINGAANQVITDAECGACVLAGDYEGLALLMQDFIEDPEKYKSCGENAKKYFLENFTMEKYSNRLEQELIKIIDK